MVSYSALDGQISSYFYKQCFRLLVSDKIRNEDCFKEITAKEPDLRSNPLKRVKSRKSKGKIILSDENTARVVSSQTSLISYLDKAQQFIFPFESLASLTDSRVAVDSLVCSVAMIVGKNSKKEWSKALRC